MPFIGIVYDPKVEAYVQALHMLSAENVTDFDEQTAMGAVDTLISNREHYAETLRRHSAELEAMAKQDAERLLELLERGKK